MIIYNERSRMETFPDLILTDINNIQETNYKNTSLNFRREANRDEVIHKIASDKFIYSKNGILLDIRNNILLAMEYVNSTGDMNSKFFKKSNRVIRLYYSFVNNEQELDYSSLYSSFKTYILKKYADEGALFEIVSTQPEMRQGITSTLDIPSFKNLEEYKLFTSEFLKEIKDEFSNE